MNAINYAQNAAFLANEQDTYQGDYIVTVTSETVIFEELDDIVLDMDVGYDD